MFACRLLNEEKLGTGTAPDAGQVGYRWLELSALREYRLYPRALIEALLHPTRAPRYLGAVN
jgi:hypothetical protein